MEYAERAALNIRTWFLDPETLMSPHMRFAQLRMGHKKDLDNGGFQSGIIETKVHVKYAFDFWKEISG